MQQTLLGAACTAILIAASGAAQSALIDRGGGLIYDQDLNVTWLANANPNGSMTWNDAMNWAGNLSYGGYTGWRLPTTLQPDASCSGQSVGDSYAFNCTGSEMGHLFYNELGGAAGQDIATTHNTNYNLFQNVQSDEYWSATEYVYDDTGEAWYFIFNDGYQDVSSGSGGRYAWAVHAGDVGAVPVPAAVWLFGSGLLGLVGLSRKRRG